MNRNNMICGSDYRITVLTDRLIRLEYQKDGLFEDRLTSTVVNRVFPEVPVFTVAGECCKRDLSADNHLHKSEEELSDDNPEQNKQENLSNNNFEIKANLIVETEHLRLEYDRLPFSSQGLSITMKDTGKVWHYSIVYGNSDGNMLGTARTLDLTDGFAELEPGIFGRNGYAVLDDSNSSVCENGEYTKKRNTCKDLYFFGYGKDFREGLKSFYTLCGKTPMIPRYALGNWWSRYFRYTENSYRELLDHFEEEQIPLSVAVIDMDWHLTDVDPKYGTGWTGYTWNKECFPDHKRFLKMLQDRKLAPTLNLHPADGIRAFETMYPKVAEKMDIDPKTEEPVVFDMSDPKYRKAYFEEVIHPYEEDGVAFWWIDWQQGTGSAGDTDPLFLLNHFHYKDQEERGVRPMIFSRYAGPGSHRYPVGFSGDTRSTWRSLAYQPFFTATAANIGYGWWSHDIGGHMLGDKDNERLTRWIQFGVFSPIMRIHSSNSIFFNKEPWKLPEPYHSIIAEFLRMRHRLLPYLYTEARNAHVLDIPMLQPLYYAYPEVREAYEVPNEYIFGSSLMVCAITEPEDQMLRMAAVDAYIPEGRWYDTFTGHIYSGCAKKRKLYRPLTSMPVLLKAGSILPESCEDRTNGTDNPRSLRILFGAGANGGYDVYEDDGISMDFRNGAFVTTHFGMEWNEDSECVLYADGANGDLNLIPEKRSFELCLYGVEPAKENSLNDSCNNAAGQNFSFDNAGGQSISCDNIVGYSDIITISGTKINGFRYDKKMHCLKLILQDIPVAEGFRVTIGGLKAAENDQKTETVELLDCAWTVMEFKDKVFGELMNASSDDEFLKRLSGLAIPEVLKDSIREIFA